MVREAEEFADEDAAVKKKIEALNALQNYVWSMQSQLKDKEGLSSKVRPPFLHSSLSASLSIPCITLTFSLSSLFRSCVLLDRRVRQEDHPRRDPGQDQLDRGERTVRYR